MSLQNVLKRKAEPDQEQDAPSGVPVQSLGACTVRSKYLVERLFNTPENTLFNYVKFRLVSQHIKRIAPLKPRIMDVGCGVQTAKQFLKALNGTIHYSGVDYEPSFNPDIVVDLNEKNALKCIMNDATDIIMLLDVLEHLHEDKSELSRIISNIAQSMPEHAHAIITLPQWYRLDCMKLSHLHYPEHKIRLTQHEWKNLIREHFDIESTQGLGYLSAIPYLPMALRKYTPENKLGQLFTHLRSVTFERPWLKPADLFLSNTLGRIAPFKYLSNDILLVVKPRASKPAIS